MANILLLEPGYRAKYPPLGLMKIAYFHRVIRGDDIVRFGKGILPQTESIKWDRIYISTLFTFELDETVRTIEFAKSIADQNTRIFVGGIAATLMEERFRKIEGINVVPGLLVHPSTIGLEGNYNIDILPPDYSILEQIKDYYEYPTANSYFAYTTRGCGMNCSFCAVKKLEPEFKSFVSIKNQIEAVKKEFGEKRDLLLMDNNVLKSPEFPRIVEEIKELGFGRGARFLNPKTQKVCQRYVDYNQGLDAYLLTEEKARLLSKLEIRPVRIAFDHIEDKEVYVRAIKRCVKAGLREFSNYILYNADATTGKGRKYRADTPEDLYERLRITLDLKEELNASRNDDDKVDIFSFPMRYIPLNATQRGYIGTNWNAKYLRAIQVMLIPTQGKGVSSKDFFEADFGHDVNEFMQIIAMPEHLIMSRGYFKQRKNENTEQAAIRRIRLQLRQELISEWKKLYERADKDELLAIIESNKFSYVRYLQLDTNLRKIYLFYFSESQLLEFLKHVSSPEDFTFLLDYCSKECPALLEALAFHIYHQKIPYSSITGYLKVFGYRGIKQLLRCLVEDEFRNDWVIGIIEKASSKIGVNYLNTRLLRLVKAYLSLGVLTSDEIKNLILEMREDDLKELLKTKFDDFASSLLSRIDTSQIGAEKIKSTANALLESFQQELCR